LVEHYGVYIISHTYTLMFQSYWFAKILTSVKIIQSLTILLQLINLWCQLSELKTLKTNADIINKLKMAFRTFNL